LAHIAIHLVWSLAASAPTSADTIAVEIKHRCHTRTPDSNPHPQSGKGILYENVAGKIAAGFPKRSAPTKDLI